MMNSITFTCETITPMFLSGADGTTPELRAPSIKEALRFWWRAMNGHLPLGDLKKQEGEIFGDTSRRSAFSLQILYDTPPQIQLQAVLPNKDRSFTKLSIIPRQCFRVIVRYCDEKIGVLVRHLFPLCCVLGGFGGRARRGFGSIRLLDNHQYPTTIAAIHTYLEAIAPKRFILRGAEILYSSHPKGINYPHILNIIMGRAHPQITKKIGQATDEVKQQNGRDYDVAIGSAIPRFASPIYVSVIQTDKGTQPIITTLQSIPPRQPTVLTNKKMAEIQEQFKNEIAQ